MWVLWVLASFVVDLGLGSGDVLNFNQKYSKSYLIDDDLEIKYEILVA